jgi:precorrin-3B synthase
MSMALNIADPRRRGACPTLYEPMQTGDGLLARIRVENGILSPDQLAELARLAQTHGNGLVEVTARGNLQVRGLTAASTRPFADAVSKLLLVSSGLVVDTSPLAGEDPEEVTDPRPVAQAIRLGASAIAHRLGPKVSVVVDAGGQVSLAAIKADIRLVAVGARLWTVTVGAEPQGPMDEAGAVDATLAALGTIASLGPEARANGILNGSPKSLGTMSALKLREGHTCPIGLPFGSIDAPVLVALAEAAEASGVSTIRLAPDHRLLLDDAPLSMIDAAGRLGFVISASDTRLRISACIGSAGCASGHIRSRALASRLANVWTSDEHLHVSGCSKGCARPRASDLTLVGRADGIGLVFNGRAGDTPREILGEAGIAEILATRREGR